MVSWVGQGHFSVAGETPARKLRRLIKARQGYEYIGLAWFRPTRTLTGVHAPTHEVKSANFQYEPGGADDEGSLLKTYTVPPQDKAIT